MRQYVARTRISGLRDQAVVQEARQFGAFPNHYRKSPQPPECVVVDAAPIEPVSSVEIPSCWGLIGAQFQKLAGKIPMHGNWEFILRKWETQNGKTE